MTGKQAYAGVGAFDLALSRGPDDRQDPKNLILLSARPKLFSFAEDGKQQQIIKKHVQDVKTCDKGFKGDYKVDIPATRYGSASDYKAWSSKDSYENYGKTKIRNFKKWKEANPKVDGIFVGDDGQGDEMAAFKALEKGGIIAAFIHEVGRTSMLYNAAFHRTYFILRPPSAVGVIFVHHYNDLLTLTSPRHATL